MSHCPSCGRYVGPHEACPYCGARITGRTAIRAVKVCAIVLATVGLAVLWFVATHADVPTVAIGQAGATMNLAYVRVQGRCTRSPSYNPETGQLGFWVADETGELYVTSYRAETEGLIEEGRVPGFGDQVVVAGTLRLREDFRSLTINDPQQLSFVRADAEACPIGGITLEQMYRRVRVRGQVRDVFRPYPGLTLLALRDDTGSIHVALSDDVIALSPVTPTVEIGQPLEIGAAISQYEGTPQLVPASTADLVLLDDDVPIADKRFVTELSAEDAGRWVALRGRVAGVEPFSKGVRLRLDDGSGVVTVLLWQDVYEGLEEDPALDAEMEVQGELAEYRGELEVIPELAADVRVLALSSRDATVVVTQTTPTPEPTMPPMPTKTPPPRDAGQPSATPTTQPEPEVAVTPVPEAAPTSTIGLTAIGSITADRVGEELTVRGTVADAVSFSHGFRLTLDDGTGQIVLLMWHDVYDDCWDAPEINVGTTVRASGEVGQFEGELQIEPHAGGDVKAVEPGFAQPPQLDIPSISGADEGRRVMIEGEVIRTEGLPSAVKVFVMEGGPEGQGEIVVFIWRNVLDRIVNNVALGTPGSRVRVVGRVQLYRSNLEIVPALPTDVTVLEMPQ